MKYHKSLSIYNNGQYVGTLIVRNKNENYSFQINNMSKNKLFTKKSKVDNANTAQFGFLKMFNINKQMKIRDDRITIIRYCPNYKFMTY